MASISSFLLLAKLHCEIRSWLQPSVVNDDGRGQLAGAVFARTKAATKGDNSKLENELSGRMHYTPSHYNGCGGTRKAGHFHLPPTPCTGLARDRYFGLQVILWKIESLSTVKAVGGSISKTSWCRPPWQPCACHFYRYREKTLALLLLIVLLDNEVENMIQDLTKNGKNGATIGFLSLPVIHIHLIEIKNQLTRWPANFHRLV